MQGKLKCLICNRRFHHLGSHIAHGHKMLAREYKEEFELPFKMALISDRIKIKKRIAFDEDREKYLGNLRKSGKRYQFKKGQSGLRRISQHERDVNIKRILAVNKKKKKPELCEVCRMRFNHVESHLYNKHRLLKVK